MNGFGSDTRNGEKNMVKLPLLMADSSIPPSGPLKGFSAQAGYIGGDTPHVWTNREWARFRHFPKLPIYVDDFRTGKAAGIDDGWKCLERLYSIGMPAVKGLAVAYDIETSKDAARALGFAEILNW